MLTYPLLRGKSFHKHEILDLFCINSRLSNNLFVPMSFSFSILFYINSSFKI